MMKAKHFLVGCALCLAVAWIAGCEPGGPATEPVTGKVTFTDGSPVPQGTVVFYSEKVTPMGQIKEDGSYTLYTGEKEGAPVGNYTIYFMGMDSGGYVAPKQDEETGEILEEAEAASGSVVAEKYLSPEDSDIKKEVTSGPNQIDISVEKGTGEPAPVDTGDPAET